MKISTFVGKNGEDEAVDSKMDFQILAFSLLPLSESMLLKLRIYRLRLRQTKIIFSIVCTKYNDMFFQ